MSPTTWNYYLVGGILVMTGAARGVHAADPRPAVILSQDAETATLANGILSATVKKTDGNLLSLQFHGLELLSRGGGYWNIYGSTPGQKSTELKPLPSVLRISQDPTKNGGALGEIAVRFPYRGQPRLVQQSAAATRHEPQAVPLDIEIRYTLRRGDSGLYGWTIANHDPHYPAFDVEVGTTCLKLDPKVFDFLSVDNSRQRHMASAEDWVKGTQLNLWEARRLNTGIRQGQVEHKYDYNVLFSQTPACRAGAVRSGTSGCSSSIPASSTSTARR